MTLVALSLLNRLSLNNIIFMHKICSVEVGDFCCFAHSKILK